MKKGKVKKYVLTGAITVVLGILSFIMYQSYGYFKVNYIGNIINTTVGPFGSYEYTYTGSAQEFTVSATGYYEVELWGASGGQKTSTIGNGGYAKGTIYLEKDEKIYIYVGEGGYPSASVTQTFNGGNWMGNVDKVPGGGATDIRLISGLWNESISLRSRIMVAGGGGGSEWPASIGGAGGQLIGGIGYGTTYTGTESSAVVDYNTYTTGGEQINGGNRITNASSLFPAGWIVGWNGTFGMGGTGSSADAGGLGGGGYYGGASANYAYGGGGGSSYISGYAGVNSVQESGGTVAQPLHTNNTIHYSGKYFIKGSMEAGVNVGNGKAKITYVGTVILERTNTNLDNVRYLKSCSTSNSHAYSWTIWNELQVIKSGTNIAKGKTITGDKPSHYEPWALYSNITDGDISVNAYGHGDTIGANCIYLDLGAIENVDEIGIWTYYGDEKVSPTSYTLLVSADNSNWTTIHDLTNHIATSQGLHYTAWD